MVIKILLRDTPEWDGSIPHSPSERSYQSPPHSQHSPQSSPYNHSNSPPSPLLLYSLNNKRLFDILEINPTYRFREVKKQYIKL